MDMQLSGAAANRSSNDFGSQPVLTIDLDAVIQNWRILDAKSPNAETAAVIKADAYGLGVEKLGPALAKAGARSFFVANAGEGVALRNVLGEGPIISVFNGYTPQDHDKLVGAKLRPILNSPDQITALRARLSTEQRPNVGLHIESGINRLGLTADELDWARADGLADFDISLVMSHLACADEPTNGMNARQRGSFTGRCALMRDLAQNAQLSLSATGGTLLGEEYHFDLVRPGIGLYGGMPFADARSVVSLHAPLLQIRDVPEGATVGYGAGWTARRDARIGILAFGYADGFLRSLSSNATFYLNGKAVPLVGRVSMDMVTIDLTGLADAHTGAMIEILGPHQTVDKLADSAGTIGYEILTSLGHRYKRKYI